MGSLTLILGKRGAGKTTALIQHARKAKYLTYLDPNGDDTVLSYLKGDILVYDPSDEAWPVAFNPLYQQPYQQARVLLDTFRAIFKFTDLSTATFDQTMYNTLRAALDIPNGTLLSAYFFLASETYRQSTVSHIKDAVVKDYWTRFEDMPEKDKRDTLRSTINKLEVMMADPRIRHTLGQFKDKLKDKQIVALLPQKELGLQAVSMFGAFILGGVSHGTVCIDGAHHFDGPALIQLINNGTCDVVVTVQYLNQLSAELRDCLLGNANTKIAFATGLKDSTFLREEFYVDNLEEPLHKLERFHARIIRDDRAETTIQPPLPPAKKNGLALASRRKYASPREHVEKKIEKFLEGV